MEKSALTTAVAPERLDDKDQTGSDWINTSTPPATVIANTNG